MVEKMNGSYRFCKVKHNPPETYGDCVKACIDTILNRDDTPHLFNGGVPEEAWRELREWLKTLGYAPFLTGYDGSMSFDEFKEHMNENNPDSVYMLFAQTGDTDHCVIFKGGEKIHDPSWSARLITGPHSFGEWIVIVLGKI